MEEKMRMGGIFDFVCYDGSIPVDDLRQPKWKENAHNVVTNTMMTSALNILYNSSGATAIWYVGLMELTGAVTTADTLASHAGWNICNCYNGDRKIWTTASATGRSITNSANKAQFVMSGTSTIWGGFICGCSQKSCVTATLACVAEFSGVSRGVASGDTVEVTYSQFLDDDGI
ncbi:MAG: hypothetical protein ABID54_00195 [Pseudomonadota bacterium]